MDVNKFNDFSIDQLGKIGTQSMLPEAMVKKMMNAMTDGMVMLIGVRRKDGIGSIPYRLERPTNKKGERMKYCHRRKFGALRHFETIFPDDGSRGGRHGLRVAELCRNTHDRDDGTHVTEGLHPILAAISQSPFTSAAALLGVTQVGGE